MGHKDEYVTLREAWSTKETAKAILVDHPDLVKPMWIPKSQISDDSEVWKGDQDGDLIITLWIAEQKGIA